MLTWLLRKLITKERRRQIQLGYSFKHDQEATDKDPFHLLKEASLHYDRGHFIEALALLDANKNILAFRRAMKISQSSQYGKKN